MGRRLTFDTVSPFFDHDWVERQVTEAAVLARKRHRATAKAKRDAARLQRSA